MSPAVSAHRTDEQRQKENRHQAEKEEQAGPNRLAAPFLAVFPVAGGHIPGPDDPVGGIPQLPGDLVIRGPEMGSAQPSVRAGAGPVPGRRCIPA